MSKKGCSPDNAACEGFRQAEKWMFYGRSWAGVSVSQFVRLLDNYLHWYNTERIKVSLMGLSPIDLGLNFFPQDQVPATSIHFSPHGGNMAFPAIASTRILSGPIPRQRYFHYQVGLSAAHLSQVGRSSL